MFVLKLIVPDFVFEQGSECVDPQGGAGVKQFLFEHTVTCHSSTY